MQCVVQLCDTLALKYFWCDPPISVPVADFVFVSFTECYNNFLYASSLFDLSVLYFLVSRRGVTELVPKTAVSFAQLSVQGLLKGDLHYQLENMLPAPWQGLSSCPAPPQGSNASKQVFSVCR
jgi:hypothetical protein